MNKDLILRERLAIERTDMAIDRTLLSFIRTSLYFAIAGWTIMNLVEVRYGTWLGLLFWITSGILLIVGLYKFYRQKKKLQNSKRHIGKYILEWDKDLN
jgi:putative membrane protein